MGAAASTVYYNLKLRHPTLDLPIIDYDLVLLIMPMLMLGISIGVVFNVIFADWMVTILLIVLFIGNGEMKTHFTSYRTVLFSIFLLWLIFVVFCAATSTKSFLKGVETWKKETIMKTVISQT